MTTLLDPPPPLPAPLPIPVRPHPPESVHAYIRRLAQANHLRPSYLRIYLSEPPQHISSVRAPRLAAASGRSIQALLRAFPDLQAVPRRRQPRDRKINRDAAQDELFNAIRREARSTFNIRTLTKMFGVPNRTIIKALARVDRPVSMPKNNPILEPFRPHIDALLTAQPGITIWAVWEIIVDEHHAEVSYGTVRDYISRQRRLGHAD
jgi:hypothetical protein